MKLPCSAPLLLLLLLGAVGALGAKEESSLEKKTMHKWGNLRKQIQDSAAKQKGENCTASPDQSHAYFLLCDLLYFHSQRVLKWAWPRYDFYSGVVDKLTEASNSNETFCSYDPLEKWERLVCDEGKCAKCDGLRNETDAQLKAACNYTGNGGKDEPEVPKDGGSIAEPEVWTPSVEACAEGWLTEEVATELYKNTASGEHPPEGSEPCDYSPAVGVAYVYAHKLAEMGFVKSELEGKREFWEDKLRILKDGKGKELMPCYPDVKQRKVEPVDKDVEQFDEDVGPWVCGKDSLCVNCISVTEEMAELNAACKAKDVASTTEQKLAEECVAIRQKMVTTTTTTTSRATSSTEEPQMTTLTNNSGTCTHRQLASTLFVSTATVFAHFVTLSIY